MKYEYKVGRFNHDALFNNWTLQSFALNKFSNKVYTTGLELGNEWDVECVGCFASNGD